MKEIEQIITDYLKAENTDYAILINGDWGSGKTYFIKKTLFEKISQIDSFIKDKKNTTLKYKPLYVSLYGINDISNVLYKVQLELNPWLKSKPWMIAKTGISKITSFFNAAISKEDEKNFLSIFNIHNNIVLFFDDLERIDKSKLSLSSVLGQINNFTEQENLKVIIVCNSEKTEEIFSKTNEKTIRFSCLYNPVLDDVYDNMIRAYDNDYESFLKTNKPIIIETFVVAKYKNLRTLRFILDIFQKIYHLVKGKEFNDEILKRFLFFTVIYSVEYKMNTQNRKDLNSLNSVGPFDISDIDFTNLFPEIKKEQEETEPSYSQKFRNKYSDIIESFHYCQEIADYIHDGYLDEEKLLQVINDLIQEIKSKEETEEAGLINKIRNWRNLHDDNFEPLKDKILNKIDNGTFTLAAYPIIFAEFLQIEHYQLYNLNIDENFIEKFKKGIDKAKEKHEYDKSFMAKIPYWSMNDKSPAKDKFKYICDYTHQANNDTTNKIYERIIDSIYVNLEQNKSQELQDIFSNPKHLNSPFLKDIEVDKFFELLTKTHSETIYALHAGIYGRYSDKDIQYGLVPILNSEIEFFRKLLELVSKKIEETVERKISLVAFIDLERNLKRFK